MHEEDGVGALLKEEAVALRVDVQAGPDSLVHVPPGRVQGGRKCAGTVRVFLLCFLPLQPSSHPCKAQATAGKLSILSQS